ncbi:MAG: hypothetical protein JMDDDDMK_02071 [Acidobacteria bacterium]|nr:hypothetical protein [Acidobacteriota bacterium]
MRVNVNEAGRDNQPSRVNHFRCARRINAPDFDDAAFFDGDVGLEPWIARAVNNAPARDDQIEISGGRRGAAVSDQNRRNNEQS